MASVLRPVRFIPKKNIERVDRTTGKLAVVFDYHVMYTGCLLPYGVIISIPYGSDDVHELFEEEVQIMGYGRAL